MKRFFHTLFALTALLTCTTAFAQRLQDGSYKTIGYIKNDGTVQDGTYKTVGYIKSNGTVQDGTYKTIGYIKSNGTVQDGTYKTIGHADSSIRKEWLAWFYFFRKS